MKRRGIAPLFICVALSACGNDDAMDDSAGTAGMPSTEAGAGGPVGGSEGFRDDYRSSSDFFTQMSGRYEGMSPHGWQQTWYSTDLRDLTGGGDDFSAPVGAVAVKEFAPDGTGPIAGLAVMVKREPGYDPDNSDWHYEMRDASGALMDMPAPGPIPDCIACHQQFVATDYLGGTNIRSGPGEFSSDYRDSADFFTQMSGLREGMSPHGWQQTWYSANLRALIEAGDFTAPAGAVAIKEFAQDGAGPIAGLAVMVKREAGYDPDNSDWHYEMRDASGAVMAMPEPGPIPDCIACHQQFTATDYLGATNIR